MELNKKILITVTVLAVVGLYFSHITMGILGDLGDSLEQAIFGFARYVSELLLINQWL